MSERYQRLYTLPPNLYLEKAPVLISAGALLKDNKEGKVLVQLKLQNLNQNKLVACKVSIRAFETSGAELAGVESYSYLDITVHRGEAFGTQEPIYLPDHTTRSFSVAVTQAVFQNGEVWQLPGGEWRSVTHAYQCAEDFFLDQELKKQFELEMGSDCPYIPMAIGGLFLCTCGTVNLSKDKVCSKCNRDLTVQLNKVNLEELTQKKNVRLAQEEADRQEWERQEAEKQRIAAEKAKRRNKGIAAAVTVMAIALAIIITVQRVIIPESQYKKAEALLAVGDYDGAVEIFTLLGEYRYAEERIPNVYYCKGEALLAAGDYEEAVEVFTSLGEYGDAAERVLSVYYCEGEALLESKDYQGAIGAFRLAEEYQDASTRVLQILRTCRSQYEELPGETIATGNRHTVGLRVDGTMVGIGDRVGYGNHIYTDRWRNVVAIAAGAHHTVGLKANGTVVAAGFNYSGECDVSEWWDIVGIAAGGLITGHTVGVKSDGTVVAVGSNDEGQCDVSEWRDIVAVAAGDHHTVGLKADGTVVAVGYNENGECNVSKWKDIVAIAANGHHTVGLKSDGRVVATGWNEYGQCDVFKWKGIVAVAAGGSHTVGLKMDGTVVAVGYNKYGQCKKASEWKDIVAIAAGTGHTVGLKADGTVVAVGNNDEGQCDVSKWKDIKIFQ